MQVFGKNRGDRWEIKGRRWERKGKRNNNIFPFTCLVFTKMEKERKKRKKKKNIYIYIYKILYRLIRPYELFLPSLFSPNLEGNNMVGHVGKWVSSFSISSPQSIQYSAYIYNIFFSIILILKFWNYFHFSTCHLPWHTNS